MKTSASFAARMAEGPARTGRSLFFVAPTLILLTVLAGTCGGDRPPEFSHSFDSPEALAEAVLDALARRDERRLAELPLSEHEFRKWVWPDLPAGRPEVNMPFDYFWKDFTLKSQASLATALNEFGGQRFTLRAVTFRGATTEYGAFAVSRDTELTVVDGQGRERTIRVFGSVLESGGRYKLFSYVVD